MINAQSVLAQLVRLGALPSNEPEPLRIAEVQWLTDELEQTTLTHRRDAAGNYWITLPGAKAQSVVLGSYLQLPGRDMLDSQLGLVACLEILKAVSRRGDGHPACTLQCVIWAERFPEGSQDAAAMLLETNAAAYLELHVEPAELANSSTALGVVNSAIAAEPGAFNPRLMELCDEAVRELTGASASHSQTAPVATGIARAGVPTAVMSVRVLDAAADPQAVSQNRLHLLEAAEAFGRWAESTIHLVAGDKTDLWAREHRVPRS